MFLTPHRSSTQLRSPRTLFNMTRSDSIRLFQIFAWAGIALIVVIVVATRLVSVLEVTREVPMGSSSGIADDQSIPLDEPLGELNSHCGGPLRLPCRPGLECSVDTRETESLGLCKKSSRVSVAAPRQLNEACESSQPCAPGLFCKFEGGASSCKTIVTGAPRVMSLKLVGAQQAEGVFRAKVGESIEIQVIAVNTKSARYRFRQGSTITDLGTMKAVSDGNYVGSLTMKTGMSGVLEVMADDPARGTAMLNVVVAAVE